MREDGQRVRRSEDPPTSVRPERSVAKSKGARAGGVVEVPGAASLGDQLALPPTGEYGKTKSKIDSSGPLLATANRRIAYVHKGGRYG